MAIHILDEQLANKIAAGEVIERPASVVKELLENALDAAATDIEVVVEEAGRKLILVTDNGCGMSREDAVISLQRHATSKIASVDDLFAIRTLGFRGEALPSIASVSHLRLVTRTQDADTGTALTVRGGTITDLSDIGCPPGTQVQVAQLFFNTPARLKFLKSDQTEMAQISDLLNALSLCHHAVSFRLLSNGREILARPASARMLSPLGAWLGRQTAEALVPVTLETPGVRIEGYVGKPEIARGNRGVQLFFVNGRRIVNRMLTHALEYAFTGLLAPKRYPVAALQIVVDPGQVDVNVHPAKAEVRFTREQEVHAAVVRAVKTALGAVCMVQELATWQPSLQDLNRAVSRPPSPQNSGTPAMAIALPPLVHVGEGRRESLAAIPPSMGETVPQSSLRPIGQFHGIFLLAEGRDALLIINQHRAHERILFERLWSAFEQVDTQRLVLPVTMHLGHREAALLDANLEALLGFGFDIAPMSGQSYLVRALPSILAAQNPEIVLHAILADMEAGIAIAQFSCDDPAQRALQESRRRLLASIACKAAIKAGKMLAPLEQTQLLDELQQADQPSLCPHGAPIIMTVSRYELDKRFLR